MTKFETELWNLIYHYKKTFKSSGGDGTPTSVNNDILYVVKFENDIVQEYHHADLLPLLVHGEGKYSCLSLKAWLIARKIYNTISESLGSNNASARNLDFLRSIFGFRPNTVITKKAIHVKLKARNRELHSDRTNRLPSNVQYVAKHVLAALRYFIFQNIIIAFMAAHHLRLMHQS